MKNSDKSHELLKCYFNVIYSFVLACIYVYARCDEKKKKKKKKKFFCILISIRILALLLPND